MKQIKILWFTNTPANGDYSLYSNKLNIGGWLKSLDIKMQNIVNLNIAYHGPSIPKYKYLNTVYYPLHIKFSILYKILRKLFNYQSKKPYIEKYINIINTVNPEIIHIHGTELLFGEIIDKIKIPVVFSIQGNITVYTHKYYSGIEAKYEKKWQNYFNIPKILFFGSSYFEKTYRFYKKQSINEQKYFAKSKNIIGRTDWDRRISNILAPNCKYFHCDEILRDSFYETRWMPHKNNSLIIHTTTGNSMYKGLETICFALNLLNKNEYNWNWQIAGLLEDDSIVNIVKKKLKKNYPIKGLSFLGNLSEKELIQKMLKADVYVLPSHIENSPNSLCEAMMLGMPCISTNAGGTSSLLLDKIEGLIIQDGDPWALAGSLIELNKNYNKAILYGNNAHEKAIIRHDKDKIAETLLNIYKIIN